MLEQNQTHIDIDDYNEGYYEYWYRNFGLGEIVRVFQRN